MDVTGFNIASTITRHPAGLMVGTQPSDARQGETAQSTTTHPSSTAADSKNTAATSAASTTAETARLEQERIEVSKLAKRDREVHAHEQAHAAAGGQFAGSPVYEFTRGPDGVNYASSGHVSIDVSKIAGDARATLDKAQIVQRAAMAPANPSSADRAVAAQAAQMATQARVELLQERMQGLDPAKISQAYTSQANASQVRPEPGSILSEFA